ncbi:putative tricarboxylate secondary active transmembrane transporter [Mycosarcoma maydis]|uniref:Mitochondrial tricarboxylate transporter 1 n=2 Tax=Mycosarcoma maydis TaxID=5270 RepID=MTT1_MYCMD|nr:putative tricarboxylate secondary active transmembrane transporter [Ustilago maydis 521]A0A0U2IR85.1 RecName: Full=Mitochondrial tricarboxylate transporter 1; AltName: Full=Itaconic acid/2-hydroxyparaconate biosynthesis cluster protein MTT1 [Ustilago maydis]ALS30799.1 mitochondrial tricarboxylate transporter [Ustilago maydis]KIS70007.1 putative tricarboxylate secondary active transmembrane transporter [Ustilago maydis 521]|eukprot:XP_011388156.1 putative tricarboxylate secondary active transmembrane transporter [Ustilago maydis 521]
MPPSGRKVSPSVSVVAGATAGAVEGVATFPIEYLKTVSQFAPRDVHGNQQRLSPIEVVRSTLQKEGPKGLFRGCTAMVVGNAGKAGVRFFAFENFRSMLKNKSTGKLSNSSNYLAGMGAGTLEAIFAVTPSETIKTKLIDDSKRAKPRYEQGLVRGTASIVRQEGLAGIYQGVVPVVMRQGSASAIRLGTYSALRDWLPKAHGSGSSLINWLATFSIGAASGVVAVYGTMPFDVLKTRMQAIDAARYRSTWHCLTNTLKTEGAAALWRGSVSRSMRLIVSGGVIFSVYEQVVWLLAGPES